MAHLLVRTPTRFMLVDHDDATHKKLLRFNRLWLTEFAHDCLLVFSTGRSPQLFHELAAEVPLLKPDILVCSVGTEILLGGQPDAEWEEFMNKGWDREAAARIAAELPELELQAPSEQRSHKISYKLSVADPEAVLSRLRERLAGAGLDTNVIYSGGVDVDILPSGASKGKALSFLLRQFESFGGRPEVLVCGDSGNDIELFAVPGVHGCMVANAHTELRQWCEANLHDRLFRATENGPGGIYQALHQFEFVSLDKEPPPTQLRRQAVVALHQWSEDWLNGAVPNHGDASLTLLEQVLAPEFDYVRPSGASMLTRKQFIAWFRDDAHGSARAQAGEPQAPAPAEAEGTDADAGPRLRIWVDRYSERELADGVWLVRYTVAQQPFAAGKHTRDQRKGKVCSALLRGERGGKQQWLSLHETYMPQQLVRA
eukprot:scaffold10.g2358.t1